MPLTLLETGRTDSIKRVGGRAETRKFLESLGFVPGSDITVVARQSGGLIVRIRQSRVAISREMAAKIMV